jgi:hypothetical protein
MYRYLLQLHRIHRQTWRFEGHWLDNNNKNITTCNKYHTHSTPSLNTLHISKSKSALYDDRRSVGQSVLVSGTHLSLTIRILLLSDICGFVNVELSPWRENGSAVYNCCWPRQSSHSRVRAQWDSWSYFTVSDLRLPFSSPSTTRRTTVEVFDNASTRDLRGTQVKV